LHSGLSYKRMEGGRLRWPQSDVGGDKVQLSREEFALLLGGIDLAQTRARKWYRKPVVEESSNSQNPA